MSESSEVEGRQTAAAVGSMYASAAGSPVEEGGGGGGAPEEEDSTVGHLELARI